MKQDEKFPNLFKSFDLYLARVAWKKEENQKIKMIRVDETKIKTKIK